MRVIVLLMLFVLVTPSAKARAPATCAECAVTGPLVVAQAIAPASHAGAPASRGILDTEGFPARWFCGTAWTARLGWMHILADVLIWLAYMAIPVILGLYMLRRRDVPFPAVGWLFVAFIFLCGTGHLIDAGMFWWPAYRLLGVVKALTAAVSVATVVALIAVLPRALALPGLARLNARLADEVGARRRAETDLRRTIQVSGEANRELAFQKFALDQAALVAITDAKGRITYVNHNFCLISKYTRDELLGRDHRIINSGHHPKSFFRDLYATIARGDVWHGEICNRAKDGTIYWVDTTIVPFRDLEGNVTRYVAIRTDISKRKRTEAQLERALDWKESMLQRERTLLRELEHRVRNNLAGLLGLTSIYERSGKGVSEVATALRGKIRAMLQVHELMSPDPGEPIQLGVLVRRIAEQCVEAERRRAIALRGPVIALRPKHAGAVAMIVQELFTNSAKYGALAREGGSLSIAWELDTSGAQHWVEFNWQERTPVAAEPHVGEGVGLRLIRGLSETELRGSAEFSFGEAGFVCLIRARLGGESVPEPSPGIRTEQSHERDREVPASNDAPEPADVR